jgi:hypothetical protein
MDHLSSELNLRAISKHKRTNRKASDFQNSIAIAVLVQLSQWLLISAPCPAGQQAS